MMNLAIIFWWESNAAGCGSTTDHGTGGGGTFRLCGAQR
jgi:hypothetical protein